MNLFNLIARITLDDKDYKKGINSAEKSGKSIGIIVSYLTGNRVQLNIWPIAWRQLGK